MEADESKLDRMFHALSDRKRRKMLLELTTKGELKVSELGKPFGMSKQAVSKHLKVLEDAGLVDKTKDGRIQRCQFSMEGFSLIHDVVQQYKEFWESQFDVLENYIETIKQKGK